MMEFDIFLLSLADERIFIILNLLLSNYSSRWQKREKYFQNLPNKSELRRSVKKLTVKLH